MKRALLVFLIPAIFAFSSIFYIKGDRDPEVVHVSESVRPGYETIPAAYTVTASPHYRWTHETGSTSKTILGFAFFAVAMVFVWFVEESPKAPEWMDKTKWYGMILFILIGAILIFGKHSFGYYNDDLSKTITVEQYEANKHDLDKIFDK